MSIIQFIMRHVLQRYLISAAMWLTLVCALFVPLGSHAADSDSFGYIYTADYLSDKWQKIESQVYMTSEFDVSGCTNPVVLMSYSAVKSVYVSPDGVTFTAVSSNSLADAPGKLFDKIAPIPRDTRYIKVILRLDDLYYLPVIAVADIQYGKPMQQDVEPLMKEGTYENGKLTYVTTSEPGEFTKTHKASVALQLPEYDKKGLRTLNVKSVYSSDRLYCTATIKRKSGGIVTLEEPTGYIPRSDYGTEILLPCDAESVDLELKYQSRSEALSIETSFIIVSHTLDLSAKAEVPHNELDSYYDFDGDGIFEAFRSKRNSGKVFKFLPLNDGSWQFVGMDKKCRFEKLFRMESDGYIYGISNVYEESGVTANTTLVRTKDVYSEVEQLQIFPTGKASVVDYDLDGQSDYLYRTSYSTSVPDKVVSIKADGGLVENNLTTMSPAEYAGVRSELKLSTGGEGIPGWDDMFGRDGGDAGAFGTASVLDINSDGIPDFIDTSTGYYFLNTGNGSFVKSSFGNRVCFRDFNGDGINDILIWEYRYSELNVKLYFGADMTKEPLMLFTGLYISDLYVRDVDNDGDLDVIALINSVYPAPSKQSYVMISENQGNGKFRKREHYIGEGIEFSGLLDIDADGKYEALCMDSHTAYMVTINSPSDVTTEIIEKNSEDRYSFASLTPVRVDQSGQWILYGIDSDVCFTKTYKANSRPQRPEAPNLVFDPTTGRLNVSWPLGSDRETPALDLTYELRIGTAPGLGDIAMAQALPDGSRRNLLAGLNGYSTHAVYNTDSWPEGKIYISYQVIDDGFMGSEFSEAVVFEKKTPASDFNLSIPSGFATRMEASAFPAFLPKSGIKCSWNVDDGEIVDIDDETGAVTFRFPAPGVKTISLTVESASGSRSTTSKNFSVEPVHFREDTYRQSYTIDLDGDGHAEIFDNGEFYIENATGEYELIKKSFNSSTGLSRLYFGDVNADGLADVFYGGTFLINYGDGDMEKVIRQCDKNNEWGIYDFNNDGYIDVSSNMLNAGDYLSTEEVNYKLDPPSGSFGFYPARIYCYDFNGDGLVDIGMIASETGVLFGKNLPFHIYENIDGRNYKKGVEISEITTQPALIDDIDGDGKADFVMCDASYNFGVTSYTEYIIIIWGSGAANTMIQCPDGDPYSSVIGAFDFNNDGMKDLSVCLQNSNQIITLYRDGSYSFTDVKDVIQPNGGVSHRRDGNLHFSNATLLAFPNERPTPPTAIRSAQSEGAVTIEWNAGTDKETPATALRYNISVKRKGAEGEGAYLISPMNGGSDVCAIPSGKYLLTSNRITIPIASIPAGEYEVMVQSVDGQNDTSEFSEIYNLTVRTSAVVELPVSGMIGADVAVRVKTNASVSDIDFGSDATVTSGFGGQHSVVWNTEGLKDIKVNGKSVAGIYIYPVPDADFTVPAAVVEGALVNVRGNAVDKGVWEISSGDGVFNILPADGLAVIEGMGENTLAIRFKAIGTMILRHTIDESYGSVVSEHTVEVGGGIPVIDMVTAKDSHHHIVWNSSQTPDGLIAVRVYRETARYNVYEVVEDIPMSAGGYTDMNSNADVKSARYRISYVMSYGESSLSEAHQPMHVQINRGVGSAVNLSWSRYEGMDVDSYLILKGSNPDALSVADEVSGHLTSYSDMSEDAETSYYAIEVIPSTEESGRMRVRPTSDDYASRSNVVYGRDARTVVTAKQVIVSSTTGSRDFNGAAELQLQARMLPTDASITKVNWEMVDGGDIMSVDVYGNVKAKAYGKATVRAIATDGSGAYGDIELDNSPIPLTSLEFTAWPDNHTLAEGETFQYKIKAEPVNASEKPLWESSNPDVAEITQDGFVRALKPGYTEISVRSQLDPDMWINLGLTVTRAAGYVEVTDIVFNINEICGVPGEVFEVEANVLPSNATDKRVEFSMEPEDTDVATVDADGRVTITGIGSAYLKAVSVSNPYVMLYLPILSIYDIVDVSRIEFGIDCVSGVPGDVIDVPITILPANATDPRVEWRMIPEDTDVATVDSNGVVTINGVGSAYLEAMSLSNPSVWSQLQVIGTSGIESVFYDSNVRLDVYTITGTLIRRQASREDLQRLLPGVYIAGGRKICILPGKF